MRIDNAGTTTITSVAATAPFIAKIGTSEVARIDGSGRLLVGTSSAASGFGNIQNFTTTFFSSIDANFSNDANPVIKTLGKGRGALGAYTVVQSGDALGRIQFVGADGTGLIRAAQIQAEVDGTPGTNDMPGRLVFSTTADGAATPTERMRIDSSGRLLVGTSTSSGGIRAVFQGNASNSSGAGVVHLQRGEAAAAITFDEILGALRGTDNADNIGAEINFVADAAWGAGDYPGRLVFSTTADGAASSTERLRITSAGVLQVADAGNIQVGTTTGTKIGTDTTQKIGFYNATPVVQPAAVADATTAVDVITQLNDLLAKLRTLGIIAT
jgi:hypothetical protein